MAAGGMNGLSRAEVMRIRQGPPPGRRSRWPSLPAGTPGPPPYHGEYPRPARLLHRSSADGAGRISGIPGLLLGWSVRETSGTTAATVVFRNGGDTKGALLVTVGLAAGESTSQWAGWPGVAVDTGWWADAGTGAWEAVLYALLVDGGYKDEWFIPGYQRAGQA